MIMQCPTPLSIVDKSDQNPYKLASKRMEVPCGRCGICKKNKRNEWTFRLREELKDSRNCFFITLTYNDENLPCSSETGEITLVKKHLQDFIKRIREHEYRKTNARKLRYYAVGEYGSHTQRPHYHVIIFNLSKSGATSLPHIWGYGHTDIGTVTPASIHYVTKYHTTRNNYDDETKTPEFTLQSQFIGYGYIDRNAKYHLETGNTFGYLDGYRINLPRIFKQKIFDENLLSQINQENIEKAREANRREAERLEKLGHADGYYELFKRTIKTASKVKPKNPDKL